MKRNDDTPRPSNLGPAVGVLLGLAVLYVLSYAPACRLARGADVHYHTSDQRIVFARPLNWTMYRPVEWVMDRTPLARPLYWWGDVWGCGSSMRAYSEGRVELSTLP